MRDQLLNGELFYTLKEAQIIIERWRIHYNTVRPHSSLGKLKLLKRCLTLPAPSTGPARRRSWRPSDSRLDSTYSTGKFAYKGKTHHARRRRGRCMARQPRSGRAEGALGRLARHRARR